MKTDAGVPSEIPANRTQNTSERALRLTKRDGSQRSKEVQHTHLGDVILVNRMKEKNRDSSVDEGKYWIKFNIHSWFKKISLEHIKHRRKHLSITQAASEKPSQYSRQIPEGISFKIWNWTEVSTLTALIQCSIGSFKTRHANKENKKPKYLCRWHDSI